MAHSYLDFRGNYVHLRDEHIYWLVSWLMEARESSENVTTLEEFFIWCESDEAMAGPGCIELSLDHFLNGNDAVRAFLELLELVDVRLRDCGRVVSADTLNRSVRGSRFVFQSQNVDVLQKVAADVRELVTKGT